MNGDHPSFETLEEELDLVISRHNDLLTEFPGLTISTLYHLVDHYRMKHNVTIDEIQDEGNGLYLVLMNGGERAAALGVDSPEKLERVESQAVMLPDQVKSGRPKPK